MNEKLSIRFCLDDWADQHPQKIAVCTDGRSITYGELHQKSSHFAAGLQKLGLKPQNRVMLFMPVSIEFYIVFFAAAKLDLNIILIDPLFKTDELRQAFLKTEPDCVFVSNHANEQLVRAINKAVPLIYASLENETFSSVLHTAESISTFPKDLRKSCTIIATSGSTGKLKFVARSFINQLIPANLILKALRITKDDIFLIPISLSHQTGVACMLCGCIAGCTMFIPSRFKAETAISMIENYHVTVQCGVPTMYIKEMNAYEAATRKPNLSSLRTGLVAGSVCPKELFTWFESHADCRLLNCYGTSEIAILTIVDYNDPVEARHNTCGRVFREAEVDIWDNTGHPQPANTAGEIVCKTPCIMQGYLGDPELTKETLDIEGHFFTGDVGSLDENGYLTIRGRKKDMIIRSGYNIFPAEIESQLLKCSGVMEACVLGGKDPVLGEHISAFIKLNADSSSTQESIRQQLEQHIAKYKLPDHIIILDEIPKLPSGKYDYPKLSAMLN